MRKGWFDISGYQPGDRTLAEQMEGLQPALERAAGKTVCDLGCAEGLIAVEFARRGAKSVYACDNNDRFIGYAQRRFEGLRKRVRFFLKDLNHLIDEELESVELWQYDIVLALAILHKLHDPLRAAAFVADAARELLVVRLPHGSTGIIKGKHSGRECDLRAVLPPRGLKLEQTLPGPRGELVQYWRR